MGRFTKASVAIDGSKFEAVNNREERGDGQARDLREIFLQMAGFTSDSRRR
jgi:hypothetical protein